jgi:COP9 signalosome complex subunit 4
MVVERTRELATHIDATTMETKLTHLATLAQKDKTPAYLSLLSETLSRTDPSSLPADLHLLIDAVANPEIVGLVTGRQVISELVKSIGAGAITDHDVRKRVVEDALATLQPRIASYEEQVRKRAPIQIRGCPHAFQVNALRFQLADLLEVEEEWTEAARVLMGVSLDSGSRYETMTFGSPSPP